MKDLKINDTLTFTGKDWKTIEDVCDTIDANKMGLESLAESLRQRQILLWEIIHAIKPELEDYKCIIEKKTKQVRVLRKNEK